MKLHYAIIILIILILITIVLVILPPSRGTVTPFLDENGNIIENSIAEKTFITIEDASIGLVIRGVSMDNPVLLFLGGGPGIPQYWLAYQYPTELEQHFTVCYLSYRGTALSYDSSISLDSLTLRRYLDDTTVVTNYLRNRFSQDKIYLMGHSFGTSIGIQAAYEHPEYYNAYIAMSQINNSARSEQMAYHYMLNYYTAQGNTSMVSKLSPYEAYFAQDYSNINFLDSKFQNYLMKVRDLAMHACGVGTTAKMRSVVTDICFPSLQMTDFTPMERINIWRGKIFTNQPPVVQTSFANIDLISSVPQLTIPVYFFGGLSDMTCCYDLQKEYYEAVEAPVKGFYTFENSAHSPLYEEPELAIQILVTDVLHGTTTMADQ